LCPVSGKHLLSEFMHLRDCLLTVLDEHKSVLISQARQIHAAHTRSAEALALAERRQIMKQYYESRIASREYFPSFQVFTSLPTVKSLLQISEKGLRRDLKTKSFQDRIEEDVASWVDYTATGVRRLLEHLDTYSGGLCSEKQSSKLDKETGHLSLEQRCTSLFACRKCRKVEDSYKRAGVLDFRGLCQHQCEEKHKSKKGKTQWAIGVSLPPPFFFRAAS